MCYNEDFGWDAFDENPIDDACNDYGQLEAYQEPEYDEADNWEPDNWEDEFYEDAIVSEMVGGGCPYDEGSDRDNWEDQQVFLDGPDY